MSQAYIFYLNFEVMRNIGYTRKPGFRVHFGSVQWRNELRVNVQQSLFNIFGNSFWPILNDFLKWNANFKNLQILPIPKLRKQNLSMFWLKKKIKKINLILGTNQSVTILTLKYVPSKIRVGIYYIHTSTYFQMLLMAWCPLKKSGPKGWVLDFLPRHPSPAASLPPLDSCYFHQRK